MDKKPRIFDVPAVQDSQKIPGKKMGVIRSRHPQLPPCQIHHLHSRKPSRSSLRQSLTNLLAPASFSSLALLWFIVTLCRPAAAAFIPFKNCLGSTVQESQHPRLLQFEPFYFWAAFDTTDSAKQLNVTTYGNVTGVATDEPYPAPDDPSWGQPNETLGKIVDVSPTNNKYSTLFATFKVLRYTQYEAPRSRFCNSTVGESCPLVPAFKASRSDVTSLPAFSVSHELDSTYAFTSITATLRVTSGDESNAELACVSAVITPFLGQLLRDILRYLPMVILLAVGLATVFAATFSPWGSLDIFHSSSNWGRDEDLLRLVTPGFADCLQYIQFVFLSASLSLNYPGFFRPVVSSVGWSVLMFNESFVSPDAGTQSVQDGLYVVDSDDAVGLDQMSQLIGMASISDIWTGMIVWLLVIIAAVVTLIQIGFALRWTYRVVANVRQQDLREKNWPFSVGNTIRIVFNCFLLPIVSLSMYQLVEAPRGPMFGVVLAAFVVVAVVGFACWLAYLIITVRPRAFLFDDLPTVLTYGPLYNTYSDEAASFAIIHIFITLLRGIAIGAVQASGIAQLVLLAICEIILGLTLNAIRPYPAPTSMNLYHTCLAILRAVTVFLSVAFAPSLKVAESSRGWIGYIILLLHAVGLVFGFFLNALQTTAEVAARIAGAGGQHGGATRGGLAKVFGLRQLQKRGPRPDNASRHSMASGAAMLSPEIEPKSAHMENGRARSLSASSAVLLQRGGGSEGCSSIQETGSSVKAHHRGSPSGQISPNTPEADGTVSKPGSGHRVSGSHHLLTGPKQAEPSDPYYRPPRQRRNTVDLISPSGQSWASQESGDASQDPQKNQSRGFDENGGAGPSISGRGTPVQAQAVGDKDFHDDLSHDVTGTKTDYYASREVDYYYGVRGPALSSGTRRLKTGPADPTGPVSSATGWFKSFFGGKTKDKGKGFEVVRSARASAQHRNMAGPGRKVAGEAPYQDHAASPPPDGSPSDLPPRRRGELDGPGAHFPSYSDNVSDEETARRSEPMPRAPRMPPSLPVIDVGGDIELPRRVNSRSNGGVAPEQRGSGRPPYIPRKSSKRKTLPPSHGFPAAHLSTVSASPPASPPKSRGSGHHHTASSTSGFIFPFGNSHSPLKSDGCSGGAESTASSSVGGIGDEENQMPSFDHARHSSSVLDAETRPSSLGYVQQHRASDNIRQVDADSPKLEGSTAEFVGHAHAPGGLG